MSLCKIVQKFFKHSQRIIWLTGSRMFQKVFEKTTNSETLIIINDIYNDIIENVFDDKQIDDKQIDTE